MLAHAFFAFSLISAAPSAGAAWKAILLSGGGTPASNAVAHEKNIQFVKRALETLGVPAANVSAYVSVGSDPHPDISYVVPLPQERWELPALDRLFGHGGIDLAYRHHEIRPVAGSAREPEVTAGLKKAAAALAPHETLLLYVTDHGRQGNQGEENAIVLWGDDELTVTELRLAISPARAGRFVTVMSQCFSGAFADVIWEPATRELSKVDSCGFFATTASRMAAGCTPELDEADYDDYTTRFIAALSGRDRLGKHVGLTADYNKDGRVSFSEAHAYSIATEETIDVPMKTSEYYLERSGISARGNWERALQLAPAEERAAWNQVASRIGIKAGDPAAQIQKGLAAVRRRIGSLRAERGELDAEIRPHEDAVRLALLERWPFLDSPFHPRFVALMADGAEVRTFLVSHDSYRRWLRSLEKSGDVENKLWQADIEEAWWLRADSLVRHIQRLANVTKNARQAAALSRLQACEAATPGR